MPPPQARPSNVFDPLGREEREREADLLIQDVVRSQQPEAPTPPTVGVSINTGGGSTGPVTVAGGNQAIALSTMDPQAIQAIQAFAQMVRNRGVPALESGAVLAGVTHLDQIAQAATAGHPIDEQVANWRQWARSLGPVALGALGVLADTCTVLGKPLLQLLGFTP